MGPKKQQYPSFSQSFLSPFSVQLIPACLHGSSLLHYITFISLFFMCTHLVIGVDGQDLMSWCNPVRLPYSQQIWNTTDPEIIQFPQPVWWNEYYSFQASQNGTITFKVYPSRLSDIYIGFYRSFVQCPQPQTSYYDAISWGVNHVVRMDVPLADGNELLLMVRMMGLNYTIVAGMPQAIPELCPSDCFQRGFCDIGTGKCTCEGGFEGDACQYPIVVTGRPITFYVIVIGVPVLVIAIIGAVVTYFVIRKKKRVVVVRPPLVINSSGNMDNVKYADEERTPFIEH